MEPKSSYLGDFFKSSRKKGHDGLPLLSVTLENGLIPRNTLERRTETNLSADEHLLVSEGDIAYNMMRVWQGALGRARLDGLVSPAYVVLKPNPKIDSGFAEYLFKTSRMIYLFWAYSYGLTKDRLRLYFDDFSRIPVSIPPIQEQKKIAQILSTWDQAIATTERLLALARQQKKALMQQLLTGKKRFSGFEGVWKDKLLGNIAKITTGSSNRQDSHLNGQYTFFDRSVDIRTSDTFLLDCEAVIVPGEGQDFIPKYFVGKFDLHQRSYAITDFPSCNGKFLYFLIFQFRSHFLSQAVGSTVKSLRLPMFQKMQIKLPSIDEQKIIAEVLTSAEQEIETLQSQLNSLKQEKKALMQVLLTGKRSVQLN